MKSKTIRRSVQLRQATHELRQELGDLLELSETENRDLTDDEEARAEELEKEIRANDAKIETLERRENLTAKNAEETRRARQRATRGRKPVDPDEDPEERDLADVMKRFSLSRAISRSLRNQPLEGAELEMYQEAEREAHQRGFAISGNVAIPSKAFATDAEQRAALRIEQRASMVQTPANAGRLVDNELQNLIRILRPTLALERVGATIMRNQTGNLTFPYQTSKVQAGWKAEAAAASEGNVGIQTFTLTPKRVAAFVEYTRQMLLQGNESIDAILLNELLLAEAELLDATGVNGSGTDPEPRGILNYAGISNHTLSDGTAIGWEDVVKLKTLIADANANGSNMNYLTTTAVEGMLMTTKKDSGSGIFLLGDNNRLAGHNFLASTNLPTDLNDGTNADNHPMIFGDFSTLIMASWGGLSIMANPYSKDKEGMVRITLESFHDIGLRYAQKFAAIKNIRPNA